MDEDNESKPTYVCWCFSYTFAGNGNFWYVKFAGKYEATKRKYVRKRKRINDY